MEKKNTFDSWKFFSTMHSFCFVFWKIFTFFEKFSQVAILKLEHCGLFYLVAYGCLHNSLNFESEKKLKNQNFRKFGFWFSKSLRTKHKIFEMRKQKYKVLVLNKKAFKCKKPQCSTFKIATCENFQSWKKTFQESIWKMTNNWHCLPADRSMVCVFWTAQHQHGQESVRNWAVRASGADNVHQIWKKMLWLVETSFDLLWSVVTAEAARTTSGSPLYLCQTYFPLSHGNGCHTMLKSRKRRILWAKKKI